MGATTQHPCLCLKICLLGWVYFALAECVPSFIRLVLYVYTRLSPTYNISDYLLNSISLLFYGYYSIVVYIHIYLHTGVYKTDCELVRCQYNSGHLAECLSYRIVRHVYVHT